MSVYRVTDIIGTSTKGWEDAAREALSTAAESLRDLRIAEALPAVRDSFAKLSVAVDPREEEAVHAGVVAADQRPPGRHVAGLPRAQQPEVLVAHAPLTRRSSRAAPRKCRRSTD